MIDEKRDFAVGEKLDGTVDVSHVDRKDSTTPEEYDLATVLEKSNIPRWSKSSITLYSEYSRVVPANPSLGVYCVLLRVRERVRRLAHDCHRGHACVPRHVQSGEDGHSHRR